ncbi:ribonuclease P/MRP protein subunit RPP1 [Phlyctochytrium arcticum]|nr:ribonuclease P/MRP protein subunit RPP1 [Phlyctochytrium arcticum]
MFADLNVPYPAHGANTEELRKTVSQLYDFGYRIIAYNVARSGKDAVSKPNPVKILDLSSLGIPETKDQVSTKPPQSLLSASQPQQPWIQQLSRLTIQIEESNTNYQMMKDNAILASFDLLAVQPSTEKAFQLACQSLDIDIISLDLSTRLPFYLRHPMVNLAISRGIYFELSYGASIRDPNARRHFISNAQSLVRVTKGRNLLLTSEASKALEIRGPYDVINLASLFGLNQALAKNAISANTRAVLLRSATRRHTTRGVVSVEAICGISAADRWKIGDLGDGDEENDMDES